VLFLLVQTREVVPSHLVRENRCKPDCISWSVVHSNVNRRRKSAQDSRGTQRTQADRKGDIIVLEGIGVEARQHVAGERAILHTTFRVDGVLRPNEEWLVGVVDVDFVRLHVDAADTVSDEQGKVDVAVALCSDDCGEQSWLG